MSRDDEFDARSLLWLLAGFGLGATVTLLFAPKTGRETRRLISRTAERGRDYLSERAEELRERSRELYERGRQSAEEAAERGRDLYERGREIADDVAERGRKLSRS